MGALKSRLFAMASSPRLTLFLLLYSTLLVFLATLDQTQIGIEAAQARYFESLLCLWPQAALWGFLKIPLLGGAAVGALAVANIVCAGLRFPRYGLGGFWMAAVHLSIALLIVSGLIQHFTRTQAVMVLPEGAARSSVSVLRGGAPAETIDLPFSVRLVKFEEKKWPGSDIPQSYASSVIFTHGENTHPALIEMNSPASYGGWTFYQSSFGDGGKTSVLSAVRNPAKILPWFSVCFTFLGMFVIFSLRIVRSGGEGARK